MRVHRFPQFSLENKRGLPEKCLVMSHWPELGHMPSLNQSLAKIKGILLHQTGAPSGLREAFQTQAAQGGRVDEMLKSQPQKKKKKSQPQHPLQLKVPSRECVDGAEGT